MKNKNFITLGFVSVAVSMSLFLSSTLIAKEELKTDKKSEVSRLEALAKFTKVISIVEQYNVDDITIEELMNKSLKGMMSNLDAHSNFLT